MRGTKRTHHRVMAGGLESARRAGVWSLMAALALLGPACVMPPVDNDNAPAGNQNDNAPPANQNDNAPKPNENGNDADPPPGSEENPLPPEPKRFTIQSQCGQLIIQCTSSYPGPIIEIIPREGQRVIPTEEGFAIEGGAEQGVQAVQFAGIDSAPGTEASFVRHQWTFGAADFDPCSLKPGPQFSDEENPLVHLAPGLHYIRLTVVNDVQLSSIVTAQCGAVAAAPAADFLELEIEIRP